MTYKILLAATASLALGLGGCNNDADDTAANDMMAANDMAANDMAMSNDMAVPAEAPLATADFIAAAAASDMYEIEAGKLAADKGSTQAIKDFGTMLQTDHKSSTDQLKADAAEVPSTMPVAEMTAEQKDMIDALKAASGADFDKAFLDQQVTAHTKALAMLNAYAAGGEADPIKQFATKVTPVVQGHLDKAKSMQQ
jgi:putative membrane protein